MNERCAPPPDECPSVTAIEIYFAIPAYLTEDDYRKLDELISGVVDRLYNQTPHGVHWLSRQGSKPTWSQADCVVLGKPIDPNAPAEGEPTFDDSILYYETTARQFVSEHERERVESERVERKKKGRSARQNWKLVSVGVSLLIFVWCTFAAISCANRREYFWTGVNAVAAIGMLAMAFVEWRRAQ